MSENIKNTDFESEMEQGYVDYAMSVITDRALPDVRDGLKPVQRRVLYAISQLTHANTPHRKCARIVGDTMGKYHPHGDSSIYEGLVNLAQNWKAQIPLIHPHGNFGNVDGSGAAAMRYTEARISAYAEDVCINDLKYYKDDFVPNFDETEMEPTYLPFQIPNILTNGSKGIAVGMATNIPTHNLGEVIDATIKYIENPDVTLDELLEVMPGPDFATGGIINATPEQLRQVYETGLGKIKVRGKVEVRDIGYGRKSICVTEIPPTMIGSTYQYLTTVANLVRDRVLPAVVDVVDRGDKNGECLCVDVKKGTSDEEIENIINILYKKTGLEDTFGVNMNCIDNGVPKVMGLKEILKAFVTFKHELYEKKYTKLLKQQEEILEVKTGLAEAVDVIDLIIEILRGSKKKADAKACLMSGDTSNIKFRYKGSEDDAKQLCFTEKQTDAILAMQLSQLIGLELEALLKEKKDAEKKIKEYSGYLSSKKKMEAKMIKDMTEIKDKYAIARKSQIQNLGEVKIKEAEQVAMDVAVLLDRFYYIKVVDRDLYEKNKEQIEKDYRFAVCCENTDRVGIFANDQQLHIVKVRDIMKQQAKKGTAKKSGAKKGPSIGARLADKGIQIFDFCKMEGTEEILYMDCMEEIVKNTLVFVMATGKAKRVEGVEFDVTRKAVAAAKDTIIYVGNASDQLVAKTKDGYYIRVNTEELPLQGKGASGAKLITLQGKDEIEEAISGSVDMSLGDVLFTRVKLSKRGGKGTKLRL